MIWDSTLPCKDKDGRLEFLDFTEDDFRMDCIFERFLMNFCKQNCRDEYPEVHREYIDFQLSPFGMKGTDEGFKRGGKEAYDSGRALSCRRFYI
uniref:hypothetical protein n=1 Tax=Segatella copri TaxID=165179 RepID=UPI003FED453B